MFVLAWALILAASATSIAMLRDGNAIAHDGILCSIVPGMLVPLVFPRVRAALRRVLDVRRIFRRGFGVAPEALRDLARSNARLAAELKDLQAAYARISTGAAQSAADAERLNHLAHHDPLTKLPNRTLLMQRFAQALTGARRAGTGVLVIYLDLDHFKTINDTMGHAAGDRVLSEIGARIGGCLRTNDTASRIGGDEFVLVCATADSVADTTQIAGRLLASISQPILIDGTTVTLGASLGVSVYPSDGTDPAELIQKADTAMYCAKVRGRNCFNLYSPEIQADIERKSRLEDDLRSAVAHNEFVVHYQPVADVRSGSIIGAEALVRWQHPTRGLLGPRDFMAFAEERGFGPAIGACVIRAVCGQLKRFRFDAADDFTIAVNVSADQLHATGFVASIVAAIDATATDPRRLEIELDEATVMSDSAPISVALRDLHALGIGVAIDDYGTGSSSLAVMKHVAVQKVKIDPSFVRDIASSRADQAIAQAIVTLAHGLGMRVIAEGVETQAQAEELRALGSDDVQGYLISGPLAAAEFEQFACTAGTLRLAA